MLASFVHFLSCLFLFSFFLCIPFLSFYFLILSMYFQVVLYAHDCSCSKTSIGINKYMQNAVEPENDAGFPKHNYSQLNCCYSYPSKPRLQCFFRLHIYGISKWVHTTATARVKARARTCTRYVLCVYLYCVYALAGGAISIRDRVSVPFHESRASNPHALMSV